MTPQKFILSLLAGAALSFFPVDASAADDHGHAHEEEEHGHEDEHGHEEEGMIHLTAAQIDAAGIQVAPAGPAKLAKELSVPGKIVAADDRLARIVPKVPGIVTAARKNLGDAVAKGEVIAIIESRDMAEAAAEFQAAQRAEDLARTTFRREKGLWDKKITAEQDYLSARNAHQEAVIRLDLARQKLQALGHEGDIKPGTTTRFHELKSPLAGRIIGRDLVLGDHVDATKAVYTLADLGTVWVETSIPPSDLASLSEGQTVTVAGQGIQGEGRLIFLSPVIDPETRSAKAVIELDNADGRWRPGTFVTSAIAISAQEAGLSVPKDALQTIEGKTAVFVKNSEGFERREVTTGRADSSGVEILTGLKAGEIVAVTNTFTLKAELGKSEAGHEH